MRRGMGMVRYVTSILLVQLGLQCVAQIPDIPELPPHLRHLLEVPDDGPVIPEHLKQYVNQAGAKPKVFKSEDYAKMGGSSTGGSNLPRERSQKGDLPYIACQVCELAMESFYNETQALHSTKGDGTVNKGVVKNIVERICLTERKEGRWISHSDIVEVPVDGGKLLKLVQQDENGVCEEECITILDSCERMLKNEVEKDTLVAIGAARKLDLATLQSKVCEDFTRRCKGNKRNKVMKDKRRDFAFKPKDKQGKKHDLLMDRLAEGGVLGDASGDSNPDVAERLFKVIESMEMRGEL